MAFPPFLTPFWYVRKLLHVQFFPNYQSQECLFGGVEAGVSQAPKVVSVVAWCPFLGHRAFVACFVEGRSSGQSGTLRE